MDLYAISRIARSYMEEKEAAPWLEKGFKLYHGQRVAKLALSLRRYILPGQSSYDDIITCAAWFHDIEYGSENHGALGAKKTAEILKGYCSTDELKVICDIIARHDDLSSDRSLLPDYLKLHQDADILDYFGITDVWTQIKKASYQNKTIADSMTSFSERLRSIEQSGHMLNYELSRHMLDDKIKFFREYTERLCAESSGSIYNEDMIVNYYYNKNSI